MRLKMTRSRWYSLLALVVVVIAVFAQRQAQPEASKNCATSIPADEDIRISLAYGQAFEDEVWQTVYADHEGQSVSVRWVDETAIGHLDYLRYNCGLERSHLENYAFEISLGGYEKWERTAQCERDGVILHEFDVIYDGQDYLTRFWLKPVNDTRLAAFQLSFPASRRDDLNTYSTRLYPQLDACPAT